MLFWQHGIPDFISKRNTIVSSTVFTGIFALVFINFYSPFDIEKWFHLSRVQLFLYSSLVVLTGMLVIVISRVIIYKINQRKQMNYLQYAFSIFIEIASMSAFFSLFVKYYLDDTRGFYEITTASIKNTSLILLIPYTVLWLYFAYLDKTKQLEQLTKNEGKEQVNDKMIAFYDDNGKMKLTVLVEDVLYLEASDNYVSIHYQSKNKLAKYLLRNSLKNLEGSVHKFGITRCHRSYMVNSNKVKLVKRERDGVFLEIDTIQEVTLPVSKTYVGEITSLFVESNG